MGYEDEFDAAFEEADEAFKAKYQAILTTMQGFSEEELQELTPTATDKEAYQQLIGVVQEATQKNLAIADLRSKIKALGETAVGIADKISGLA
ncbi:MAG: hypothetical protein ACE5G1_03485, partial [bacterium]